MAANEHPEILELREDNPAGLPGVQGAGEILVGCGDDAIAETPQERGSQTGMRTDYYSRELARLLQQDVVSPATGREREGEPPSHYRDRGGRTAAGCVPGVPNPSGREAASLGVADLWPRDGC